jgi:hypothetical protein
VPAVVEVPFFVVGPLSWVLVEARIPVLVPVVVVVIGTAAPAAAAVATVPLPETFDVVCIEIALLTPLIVGIETPADRVVGVLDGTGAEVEEEEVFIVRLDFVPNL